MIPILVNSFKYYEMKTYFNCLMLQSKNFLINKDSALFLHCFFVFFCFFVFLFFCLFIFEIE